MQNRAEYGLGVKMGNKMNAAPRRVLIASANPLFGKGLRSMYQQRWGDAADVVGLTTTMEETLHALEELQPDLVILDFDDRSMDREEFLNHFVASERPMQVILVSLQGTGAVVVYDRRTLSPSQAEKWLGGSWTTHKTNDRSTHKEGGS